MLNIKGVFLLHAQGLKLVSALQAAKLLGLRPCLVEKTIKAFCKDPDPTSWLSTEYVRAKRKPNVLTSEQAEIVREF